MTYNTIADMAEDVALARRITAAVAQEGEDNPSYWTSVWVWSVVAQPGWDAAYASAVAGGIENPGASEVVITDGMILSGVQAVMATIPPPEPGP
jgi:hypothetical protein